MKKAVVAEIDLYDKEVNQRLVEVNDNATWKIAYFKAFIKNPDDKIVHWIEKMPENLEEAKQQLLSGDMMIDILFLD